jgi:hypothetical protein
MVIDLNTLLVLAIILTFAALVSLRDWKNRTVHKAEQLEAAATALEVHYDAMASIIDDPALPLRALQLLTAFSEGLTDEASCRVMMDGLAHPASAKQEPSPKWFDEIQHLRRTRPELVDRFFVAIESGIAAAFLRWPGNDGNFEGIVKALVSGKRREAELAERVSRAHLSMGTNIVHAA